MDMMDMMKRMMGENSTDGCWRMMQSMMGQSGSGSGAAYAPEELRALFEDWLTQLEEEVLSLGKDGTALTEALIAQELRISEPSARFILAKLIADGRWKPSE